MGKVAKIALGALMIAAVVFAPQLGIAALMAASVGGIAVGGTLIAIGASLALGGIAQAMAKMPQSQLSRLNPSLDPSTPRKAVFGTTAMPTDIRYHESSGTDQEYIDYILACTAHEVASIDEIWFEEKKAWDASTGVTSTYSGYLTVNVRTEGTSGNYISINGGAKWGSTCLLTGCSYVHIRIKRTGNSKKTESPLTSGLPGRVTIIGEGALLYDPRLDSTVPGGSGSHRADDQSTWGSYTDPDDTDNPALQLLWWMLGWKINDKLSIGCGVPPERIDLESFITAANICDETVTLATGGSQARYRASGTATDADGRMDIINTFLACMNGTLRDSDGKLSLTVLKNDLAEYVLDLDDDDILDEFQWDQTRGLDTGYNKARGRYVDPSSNSLYQLSEYPEVGFDSIDGIERVLSLDLPYVEDGRRAQRIAKQVLQRNQYRGLFSSKFTAKAMGAKVGDVVRVSFAPLGWSRKLFRITTNTINMDATVSLSMVEENPAIYAWDAEDSAPVTPTAPTIYDPLNNPFILADIDEVVVSKLDPLTGNASDEFLSADAYAFGQIVENGTARDGDTVTFATTLPRPPRIVFLPGGEGVTAGENIRIKSDGLTTTGFSMVAKSQVVTAGSTITDASPSAGGAGDPDSVIDRTNSGNPFDGVYTYRISANIVAIDPYGTPDPLYVTYYAKISSAWVEVASQVIAIPGGGSNFYNLEITPGTVDFGAGEEFGVSFYAPQGSSTGSFVSVAYTLGTVVETVLTPSGSSSIPWIGLLD